jgi:hypothetical protein
MCTRAKMACLPIPLLVCTGKTRPTGEGWREIAPRHGIRLLARAHVCPQGGALRLLWRIVLRSAAQNPRKIKTVAVLRVHREDLKRNLVRSEPRCGPLFDTAKTEGERVKTMGTTNDGGEGGLRNSIGALLVGRRADAADPVARGTCQPSLASHTDISDRHITLVSRSMVGGLEVDLALRFRRLRSVSGLVASRKRISDRQRHHSQAEDIFLTQRAWRVGIAIVLTNLAHTRWRGPGGQQNSM